MRIFLILLFSTASALAAESESPVAPKLLKDLPYVPEAGSRQRLDLYLPATIAGKKPPLIVWIHGGNGKAE